MSLLARKGNIAGTLLMMYGKWYYLSTVDLMMAIIFSLKKYITTEGITEGEFLNKLKSLRPEKTGGI